MPQSKEMKIQWVKIDGRDVPFVLPQIWDESIGDWVVTSDVNPLPVNVKDGVKFPVLQSVKDADVNTRLVAIEKSNADILEKLNGVLNTQVTGSNVELKRWMKQDQLLITSYYRYGQNTAANAIQPLDLKDSKRNSIYIANNHDVAISVAVRLGDVNDRNIFYSLPSAQIPSGSSKFFLPIEFNELNEPFTGLSLTITRTAEPTTGSLDVIFFGGN